MHISRLFEITHMLLNKKRLTASQLAEHFEVSTRTIYRDIEALSTAGIPIFMSRGKGGGIELLPNYVLKPTLLNDSEQMEIISALQSLSEVQNQDANALLEKLGATFGTVSSEKWIEIDYSDWSNTKRTQFETIKQAILFKNTLEFLYHNRLGQSHVRKVDPLRLWFKERSWYLKAFCHYKQSIRLFKLNRIRDLKMLGHFDRTHDGDLSFNDVYDGPTTEILVRLDPSQAYRVYDEFEADCIKKQNDGHFLVSLNYAVDDWVVGYLLSFGAYAEVIEPAYLRDIIKESLEKNLQKYL